MCACVWAYMYTCVGLYMHVGVRVHVCGCICACVWVYVCMCVCLKLNHSPVSKYVRSQHLLPCISYSLIFRILENSRPVVGKLWLLLVWVNKVTLLQAYFTMMEYPQYRIYLWAIWTVQLVQWALPQCVHSHADTALLTSNPSPLSPQLLVPSVILSIFVISHKHSCCWSLGHSLYPKKPGSNTLAWEACQCSQTNSKKPKNEVHSMRPLLEAGQRDPMTSSSPSLGVLSWD